MTMLMDGKTVVITGAAAGIGLASARLLAAHGARIALLDIDAAAASAARDGLSGPGHVALACDVTRDADCCEAAEAVLEAFGAPSVLVNNAGYAEHATFLDLDIDRWKAIMDVNVYGAVRMSRALLPAMRKAGRGSVVNVSSVAGQRGGRGFGGPHYTATKAALIGLTKSMAREFADDGIRVNAVAPGFTETNIFKGRLDDATRAQMIAALPLGRGGTADDIAGAMLYLASDLSSFVTGATIDVNGGGNMR